MSSGAASYEYHYRRREMRIERDVPLFPSSPPVPPPAPPPPPPPPPQTSGVVHYIEVQRPTPPKKKVVFVEVAPPPPPPPAKKIVYIEVEKPPPPPREKIVYVEVEKPAPPPRDRIVLVGMERTPQSPSSFSSFAASSSLSSSLQPYTLDEIMNTMMKSVMPQESSRTEARVIRLTSNQEAVLQEQFNRWPKNPHKADVVLLAAETGLSEEDVQDWYSLKLAQLRKEQGLGGGFGLGSNY